MCGGWSAGRCRLFWGVDVSCEAGGLEGGTFLDEGEGWRWGLGRRVWRLGGVEVVA